MAKRQLIANIRVHHGNSAKDILRLWGCRYEVASRLIAVMRSVTGQTLRLKANSLFRSRSSMIIVAASLVFNTVVVVNGLCIVRMPTTSRLFHRMA